MGLYTTAVSSSNSYQVPQMKNKTLSKSSYFTLLLDFQSIINMGQDDLKSALKCM